MNKKVVNRGNLLFLNSGDILANQNVIESIYQIDPKSDIVYGNLIFDNDGDLIEKKFPNDIDLHYLVTKFLPHPSMFIKRELFTNYGFYNEKLKVISDWEFYLNIFYNTQSSFKYVDDLL